MRVLLIYPLSWKRLEPTPPLGTATLAAALRAEGHEVVQLDLELEGLHRRYFGPPEDALDTQCLANSHRLLPYLSGACRDEYVHKQVKRLLSCIDMESPDAVGLSLMGYNQLYPALLIALYAKTARPEVPVIAGGQFVQYNGEELLRAYPCLDYCVCGDAWTSLP